MFQLDDNLLKELGLGDLPAAEKMTDAQLDEFEKYIDANDEAGALKWLETNFPNYKDVVADELEKLKSEIRTQAPQIMEATLKEVQSQQPPAA